MTFTYLRACLNHYIAAILLQLPGISAKRQVSFLWAKSINKAHMDELNAKFYNTHN